jgi:hypothetical protein
MLYMHAPIVTLCIQIFYTRNMEIIKVTLTSQRKLGGWKRAIEHLNEVHAAGAPAPVGVRVYVIRK